MLHSRVASRPAPPDWGKNCWPSNSTPFVPQGLLAPSGSKRSNSHEPERRRWTDPAGTSDNTVSNALAVGAPFSPEGPSEGYVQTKVHKDALHRCFMTFAVSSGGIKQKHLRAPHQIITQPHVVFQTGT